jgi:hypothetical protein
MNRFAAAFIFASLFSSPAAAADWSATDTILTGAALATIALDWGQTRTIARNPDKYRETNPILGPHPSLDRVNAFFALSMLATVGIAIALPPRDRKIFLGGVAIVETAFVIHNHGIGIRASW